MISVGNPSILSDFLSLFQPKCSYAVSMATGMHTDERSIDCFVLGHHDQDWKVSAKSVTMRAMTLCKNLSGYRELLLITCLFNIIEYDQLIPKSHKHMMQSDLWCHEKELMNTKRHMGGGGGLK